MCCEWTVKPLFLTLCLAYCHGVHSRTVVTGPAGAASGSMP